MNNISINSIENHSSLNNGRLKLPKNNKLNQQRQIQSILNLTLIIVICVLCFLTYIPKLSV